MLLRRRRKFYPTAARKKTRHNVSNYDRFSLIELHSIFLHSENERHVSVATANQRQCHAQSRPTLRSAAPVYTHIQYRDYGAAYLHPLYIIYLSALEYRRIPGPGRRHDGESVPGKTRAPSPVKPRSGRQPEAACGQHCSQFH